MDIHPLTKRSIDKVFKYNDMSVVQEAVLSRLPNENDMFVKAKTGTGKTLAFLIAALETVLKDKSAKDIKYFEGTSILIISPTRELASQIATEAEKLTKFLPFQVHCLVGGESKRAQINKLERGRSDIVVATPGRLYDMLSSVRHLKRACENIQVLVLDEADQLIDMGFKEELKRILALVPEKRQTMLYSATISDDIKKNLGNFALSPKYDLIDTVGKDDVSTHLHVKQSALVTPYDNQLQHVQNLLMNHDASKTGKVIVFLPTTKQTKIYAHLLQYLVPDRTIHELHSGKDQRQRVRISNRFRKSNNDILVTSDVSARGVDYPGVSLVLQIGVPATREQYIHRIGRTGRAGREGEGIIVLAPFENEFLKREVADLPIEKLVPPEVDTKDIEVNQRAIKYALKTVDSDYVREVYTGFLGFYASRMITLGKPRSQAIKEAGDFVKGLGIEEVPHLSDRFIQQLGLNDRQPRFERERSQRGRPSNRRNFDRNDNNKRSYDRNDNKRSYGRDDNLKSRFNRYENDDDDFPSRKPKFNKFNNEGSDEFSNRQPRFNKYNGDDNDEFPNRRRRSSRRDNSDFGEKKHRSNRGDFDYVFKNRSN
ncbi:P-loop containing nucleoside triphosphate hydrolase protein [Cunninghamella echinulata]|nr:P-loop containing nucleoside triphosphate hydrolase protein [Cunninghamella echinulata]